MCIICVSERVTFSAVKWLGCDMNTNGGRWQHLNPEHCSSIQSQLLHLGRGKHQLSSLPPPTRNSKPLPASVTRLSTLLCPWISHKFKETKHRRWKGQRTSCSKSHIVIIITFRSVYHFTASRWAGRGYSEYHNKWTTVTSFDAKYCVSVRAEWGTDQPI